VDPLKKIKHKKLDKEGKISIDLPAWTFYYQKKGKRKKFISLGLA
jgi:hypothetical protein